MLAEIDRLQKIRGDRYIHGNAPNHRVAAQALEQIGVLKMIKSPQRPKPTHREVIYWRYTNGTEIEAEKVGTVIEQLLDVEAIDHEITGTMMEGATEAMTNSVMHAYDSDFKQWNPLEKHWWMFAGIREEHLTIIMCDLGLGIPNSLQLKHDPTTIEKMLNGIKDWFGGTGEDSRRIKISMEIGSTSSDLDHRGLGMSQLKSIIDTMREGNLFILSNRGCYNYNYTDGRFREHLSDFKSSVDGTIIGWKIPVKHLKLLPLDASK